MEDSQSGVVPVDEGVSPEGTVQAGSPFPPSTPFVAPVVGDQAQESPESIAAAAAELARKAELERIPPELRPDANGNPPVITEKLLKSLRNRYFTVKHVLLENCGHKLDMINQPKTNCENCWFQWFNTHPALVETTDQFFRVHGKAPLISMRGEKYFKMFVRYMATIIHFMKEEAAIKAAKEAKETNGNQVPEGTQSLVSQSQKTRAPQGEDAEVQSGIQKEPS